jgi:hypothetical protein
MNAIIYSKWLAGEARDRLLTATKPSLAGLAGSLGRGV